MVQRGAEEIEDDGFFDGPPMLFHVYPQHAQRPSRAVRRHRRSRIVRVVLLCILLIALVAAIIIPFGSDGGERAAPAGAAMVQLAGR